MDVKKNTLYIIDMDVEISGLVKHTEQKNLEPNIVLQIGPISSPFDEIMRTIILTVYEHNIEQIVVITPTDEKQTSLHTNLLEKLQENEKTLNYLFTYCKPEFPVDDIKNWLRDGEQLDGQHTAQIIQLHPLLPSDIKVIELSVSNINRNLSV